MPSDSENRRQFFEKFEEMGEAEVRTAYELKRMKGDKHIFAKIWLDEKREERRRAEEAEEAQQREKEQKWEAEIRRDERKRQAKSRWIERFILIACALISVFGMWWVNLESESEFSVKFNSLKNGSLVFVVDNDGDKPCLLDRELSIRLPEKTDKFSLYTMDELKIDEMRQISYKDNWEIRKHLSSERYPSNHDSLEVIATFKVTTSEKEIKTHELSFVNIPRTNPSNPYLPI